MIKIDEMTIIITACLACKIGTVWTSISDVQLVGVTDLSVADVDYGNGECRQKLLYLNDVIIALDR